MYDNLEPAFPVMQEAKGYGLTKFEYFAVQAMQGILSGPESEALTSDEVVKRSLRIAGELAQALKDAP